MKKFKNIPIESRTMFSQKERIAKGALKLWVELVPKPNESLYFKQSLTGQNLEKYELRCVIWNTRAVPFRGDATTISLYVKIVMSDGKKDIEQVNYINKFYLGNRCS